MFNSRAEITIELLGYGAAWFLASFFAFVILVSIEERKTRKGIEQFRLVSKKCLWVAH